MRHESVDGRRNFPFHHFARLPGDLLAVNFEVGDLAPDFVVLQRRRLLRRDGRPDEGRGRGAEGEREDHGLRAARVAGAVSFLSMPMPRAGFRAFAGLQQRGAVPRVPLGS